jgi:hypothetical protein
MAYIAAMYHYEMRKYWPVGLGVICFKFQQVTEGKNYKQTTLLIRATLRTKANILLKYISILHKTSVLLQTWNIQ